MDQTQGHGARLWLKLAARPSAVPRARGLLAHMLCEWQLAGMSDTVLLLMSELVTNAVKASGDGTSTDHLNWQAIALTVRLTDTSLVMEIWDANPAPPVPQESDLTADCGRGLLMVETLCDKWGYYSAPGGKVVWCQIDYPG